MQCEVIMMNSILSYERRQAAVDTEQDPLPAFVINKLEAVHVLAATLLEELVSIENNADAVAKTNSMDLSDEVHRFEREMIRCALLRTGGRLRKAARLLNIKPPTLHSKMKRYGLLNSSENFEEQLPPSHF